MFTPVACGLYIFQVLCIYAIRRARAVVRRSPDSGLAPRLGLPLPLLAYRRAATAAHRHRAPALRRYRGRSAPHRDCVYEFTLGC